MFARKNKIKQKFSNAQTHFEIIYPIPDSYLV